MKFKVYLYLNSFIVLIKNFYIKPMQYSFFTIEDCLKHFGLKHTFITYFNLDQPRPVSDKCVFDI